jgi:unsaturated chondroitin disaccharide hydrolase
MPNQRSPLVSDPGPTSGTSHAAQDILASLASSYLTLGTPNQAVLAHSVGSFRQDSEVDVGLVYADYYLLEAINRLHRQ